MRYKIKKQKEWDERLFELEDENGETFTVDFYTAGYITHPQGADETPERWKEWLGTFVGKTIEIEKIVPWIYFASGKVGVGLEEIVNEK